MTNGNGKEKAIKDFMEASDEVSKEFVRTTTQVPLIKVSQKFADKPIEEQSKYWHKLASSLNHACQTIQKERDALNKLLFDKEALIEQLHKKLDIERNMVQIQLATADKKYQTLLNENQELHAEIKQLEGK